MDREMLNYWRNKSNEFGLASMGWYEYEKRLMIFKAIHRTPLEVVVAIAVREVCGEDFNKTVPIIAGQFFRMSRRPPFIAEGLNTKILVIALEVYLYFEPRLGHLMTGIVEDLSKKIPDLIIEIHLRIRQRDQASTPGSSRFDELVEPYILGKELEDLDKEDTDD